MFLNHGEDWKRIRSIATPAFTSGKLRKMFPLLKQSTDKLEKYLSGVSEGSNPSFNVKDVITGFTIDVIASTSFGTDTDSNSDRSKFNPFLHHGEAFFYNTSILRFTLLNIFPKYILRILNIPHPFAYDSFDFFVNACKTMIQRSRKRDDLITLLREANVSEDELNDMNFNKLTTSLDNDNPTEQQTKQEKNNNPRFLTDEEIIAQCVLFFVAGFETTGATLTNTIFLLARNPEVQERLYDEVCENLADVDPNNLDKYYETINTKISYLDAVIKETLRLYPPVTRLERRLNIDEYKLGGIQLQRDHLVEISTIAVHYDPDNFSNPKQYSPERFLPENKHKLAPYSYIPFGDGPRNCVGMRFAYQEAKICLASLIQKFRFKANAKTPERLSFPAKKILLTPDAFEVSIESRA